MSGELTTYPDLNTLVTHLRSLDKKYILLFAYNGTGKTRLSMDFRHAGKQFDADGNVTTRDTLYFNAFTEDLFYWDNDLLNDVQRVLKLNKSSRFFDGLQELEMDNKIRPLVHRYSNFNFLIDYEEGSVNFIREEIVEETAQNVEHIKVSRGEENIFIWCFFLAIVQLSVDRQEAYNWVKYIYIDDPVSSLDDNNTIAIAHHLASILKAGDGEIKTVISTHHALFFNVLHNEFGNRFPKYFLSKSSNGYTLRNTNDSPFFYHVSLIQELQKAIDSGNLYTYHFNVLRMILEKAANFHGFNGFSDCLQVDDDDENRTLHARLVNILNHGTYSMFEPTEMGEENKLHFKQIFDNYKRNYKFNEQLFEEPIRAEPA
jgi:hypothetical protein